MNRTYKDSSANGERQGSGGEDVVGKQDSRLNNSRLNDSRLNLDAQRVEKILIVLFGAIGDVCRALPLATRIRRNWPQAKLMWAVEPRSQGVLIGHGSLDKVILFSRGGGWRAYLEFIRNVRAERFDLVLDLQRHFKSGVTSRLSGAPRRMGFHSNNAKEFNWVFNNQHIPEVPNFSAKVWHYQLFGDALGLPPESELDFGVDVSDAAEAAARLKLSENWCGGAALESEVRGYVGLLLGSTWPSRFWFADYYCELAKNCWERWRLAPVFIGARSEEKVWHEIRAQLVSCYGSERLPIVDLVSKTELFELFAVFKCLEIAVGPDCGPMHIASTVKLPVISLWGSTTSQRSAPYGSEGLVMEPDIKCSPCYRRQCPGLGRACMRGHLPNKVMSRIEECLHLRCDSEGVGEVMIEQSYNALDITNNRKYIAGEKSDR